MRPAYSACLSALFAALLASGCAGVKRNDGNDSGMPVSGASSSNQNGASKYDDLTESEDVSEFINQMVAKHGFDRAELESVFQRVRYVDTAVQLMKPPPPGRPRDWRAYRARIIEPVRINAGTAFWDKYAGALARAEELYGVPPEIIIGIIGVETIFGRNTGTYRVLDTVTTLAFDYPSTSNRARRMQFFRGEIENTLLFARESGIDPFSLVGSYAGAIGLPQFMPSSIRKYAVDFDGDGKVDLRNSPIDAIGSVANFLVQHGWQRGRPIVFPANVPLTENAANWKQYSDTGLEVKFRLDELAAAGISPGADPPADMLYALVDLQNGQDPTEYWLGTTNFFAITKYNRSYFYAMSVVDLGRAVRAARKR